MSLRNRFVDGVNSLFEKLGKESALGNVDPEALEQELAERVAARKSAGDPSPKDNAKARLAAAGKAALEKRIALASKRVASIHKARRATRAAKKREEDAEEQRRAKEEAARPRPPRYTTPPRTSNSAGDRTSRGAKRRTRPSVFQNKDLAGHYKTLGVDYGADATTIKKAYRKLMRKYHPDLHQDPKKKKAATRLTVKISTAYDAIEKSKK